MEEKVSRPPDEFDPEAHTVEFIDGHRDPVANLQKQMNALGGCVTFLTERVTELYKAVDKLERSQKCS